MSEPKIEHLPGTFLTPKVLLARLLEEADGMEAVAVVFIQGEQVLSTWSQVSTLQLIGLVTILQQDAIDNASAPTGTIDG